MSPSLIVLLVIQAISLIFMSLFYFEYHHIQMQRAEMFHQLEHSQEPTVRGVRLGLAYLLGAIVILVASFVFFFSFALNA